MNTTLNNYTINDFLKLKPIIYEYCVNLTKKKDKHTWNRDFSDADDLYQDVYLYVQTKYFNKPKDLMTEGKFIQIMKNCTFWAFHKRITNTSFKIHGYVNYFQESEASLVYFESQHADYIKIYEDIQDHPDYNFYMKNLKFSERLAIQYFLKGYTKTEVAKKFNKTYAFIPNIVKKIEGQLLSDKFSKPKIKPIVKKKLILDDVVFLKQKVKNYDIIFNTDKFIKLYSLYLQGISNGIIAKRLNKSVSQVNVEIYRINQKIKKYGS